MHFQSKKRMRRMGVPTPGGYCRTSTPSYTNRRKKGPKGFPFNPQILRRTTTSYERFRTKEIVQTMGVSISANVLDRTIGLVAQRRLAIPVIRVQ